MVMRKDMQENGKKHNPACTINMQAGLCHISSFVSFRYQ